MLEFRKSTNILVPVLLTSSSDGSAHTGVVYSAVTVTIAKANITLSTFTPDSNQWTEFTASAFAGSGYYNLTIPYTYTDIAGPFQYCVKVTGDDLYFGFVAIVDNLEVDTYGSVSAVASTATAIKAKTDQIPDDLSARIARILGLGEENSVLDNTTFDGLGNMLTGRMRIFSNPTDTLNGTNPIAIYDITASWSGQNVQNYTMVRRP
jgi:hypothetical protein